MQGRTAIVTGAGRGIGRAHALAFAAEGANVVVNDVDADAAAEVAEATGGVANTDDVADWAGAERLVRTAIETFGDLHALVNNAGFVRDRMLVSMTEDEWDAVVRVHLKGTFAPLRHAAAHWREQVKAGGAVDAAVLNTSSAAGLIGNLGQGNYGAAKAGIAALTRIAAAELGRYGVRVNAIAPAARTRMTEELFAEMMAVPEDGFDIWDPANISPLVVWLASPDAAGVTGQVFEVTGSHVVVMEGWQRGPDVDKDDRWTPAELSSVVPGLVARARPHIPVIGTA